MRLVYTGKCMKSKSVKCCLPDRESCIFIPLLSYCLWLSYICIHLSYPKMNICYLNTTKTEDGIPPSLLDELCQQSPPNVQFINSWCVSKTVIMAKKSCKGVSGNFFQTNPSRALSFCRLYHFFSQKKPPPAAGGAVTAAALSAFSGLGARASWLWPQRVALEREETLAFFHGMENLHFRLHWKKVFFCFLWREVRHEKSTKNTKIKKTTAHDSCLLKHSAFCLGVTHQSLCIAELRFFERPLSPPPTSPQPLEIRLLKPKLTRRWWCPQDSNPIRSTGHVSILVSRFFRWKHLIHTPFQVKTLTSQGKTWCRVFLKTLLRRTHLSNQYLSL